MTQEEIRQKIKELETMPIRERPRAKAIYRMIEEQCLSLEEREYEPIWMQEAYIKMAYSKQLQMAVKMDSEDHLYQLKNLFNLSYKI